MKTIVLMRHAHAGQEPGESDFQRGLTSDGVQIATETATAMLAAGLRFDRVISSSAVRTRSTADLVANVLAPNAEREDRDELYLASTREIKALIRGQSWDDEASVLVVGHNPGIAGVICRWANQSLSVPPATVAVFQSSADTWNDVRKNTGHGPALICLLQDGKVVWRSEANSDSKMPDLL